MILGCQCWVVIEVLRSFDLSAQERENFGVEWQICAIYAVNDIAADVETLVCSRFFINGVSVWFLCV